MAYVASWSSLPLEQQAASWSLHCGVPEAMRGRNGLQVGNPRLIGWAASALRLKQGHSRSRDQALGVRIRAIEAGVIVRGWRRQVSPASAPLKLQDAALREASLDPQPPGGLLCHVIGIMGQQEPEGALHVVLDVDGVDTGRGASRDIPLAP